MLEHVQNMSSTPSDDASNPATGAAFQASTLITEVATLIRRVADEELMPRFRRVAAEKKHDGSIVTAADRAVEAVLTEALPKIFSCRVLGEEMPLDMQRALWRNESQRDDWIWCVDPLDGTANFASGKKYFGISIALMHHRRSRFGMIYDPNAHELFYAIEGEGAWMESSNGTRKKLHMQPSVHLHEASLEIGRFKRLGRLQAALKTNRPFKKFAMSGASVLQWSHLAAGRIDTFLHAGEHPWDYAAGALILEEAGGRVASLTHDTYWRTSDPDSMWEQSVIAARHPALFDEWKRWVRMHY
jgi:myo-inositol-1(or 4)-monophosphatase